MSEIDAIRNEIRGKKVVKKKSSFNLVNKFLLVVLLTLITLILLKSNSGFKEKFYKYVYEDNIAFSKINSLYQKYFGKVIPVSEEKTEMVFNETLSYSSASSYKDGVMLKVEDNYLVPSLDSGMVIFIGEKDGYGNTVVIEQTDGTEVWYGNIKTSLKMYDYVDKGATIGNVDNKLYLAFKKDGNFLNYEDYI